MNNSNQSPLMGGEEDEAMSDVATIIRLNNAETAIELIKKQFVVMGKKDNVSSPSNSGDASVVSLPSTDNTPITPTYKTH